MATRQSFLTGIAMFLTVAMLFTSAIVPFLPRAVAHEKEEVEKFGKIGEEVIGYSFKFSYKDGHWTFEKTPISHDIYGYYTEEVILGPHNHWADSASKVLTASAAVLGVILTYLVAKDD